VTAVWYLADMKSLAKGLLGIAAFVGLAALSGFVVRQRVPSFGTPDDSRIRLTAALDGIQFTSVTKDLVDASALAYLGGIELDLTRTVPAPGAVVRLRAVLGGIDVVVPDTWRVEVASRGSMSGIANLTDPDSLHDGPLVVVEAMAFMGGIEIHARGDSDGS
jgi:hypothetical protein